MFPKELESLGINTYFRMTTKERLNPDMPFSFRSNRRKSVRGSPLRGDVRMKPFSARISDVLAETVRGKGDTDDPTPMLGDLVALLGKRSFGIVLVLFGLPNLLPVPGLPILCGVIVGVVALQMLRGHDALVLPRWLAQRRIKRRDLQNVLVKSEPTLRWFERVMRPRLLPLTDIHAQRAIGALVMVMAVCLMSPIPFIGGIPPGIAVILVGLAMVERDGVVMLVAAVAALLALIFTVALTYLILWKFFVFLPRLFGFR